MFCEECGCAVAETKFCRNCGTKVPRELPMEEKVFITIYTKYHAFIEIYHKFDHFVC